MDAVNDFSVLLILHCQLFDFLGSRHACFSKSLSWHFKPRRRLLNTSSLSEPGDSVALLDADRTDRRVSFLMAVDGVWCTALFALGCLLSTWGIADLGCTGLIFLMLMFLDVGLYLRIMPCCRKWMHILQLFNPREQIINSLVSLDNLGPHVMILIFEGINQSALLFDLHKHWGLIEGKGLILPSTLIGRLPCTSLGSLDGGAVRSNVSIVRPSWQVLASLIWVDVHLLIH
jgi:hypothetical protein